MIENSSVMGSNQAGAKNLKQHYSFLEEAVLEYAKIHPGNEGENMPAASKLVGYPLYPPPEDIYNQ